MMINSKLIQILKSFSKDELKEFEKFLASPFFSKGRDLLPLFNSLKKFYPNFGNENFTYEKVFTQVYGKKEYNYELINKLFSEMMKASEEYLAQIAFRKDFMTKKHLLMRELIARKIDSRFKVHVTETEDFVNSQKLHANYFADKVSLEELKYDFNYSKDKQELVTDNVVKRSVYNLLNFLTVIGSDLHDLRVNSQIFNSKFVNTSLYKFISSINFELFINSLNEIKIEYYEIHEFITFKLMNTFKNNLKYFQSYKNFFFENLETFREDYKKVICISLDSAYLESIKDNDNLKIRKEQFEFIKLILQHKIYHYNNGKSFPLIPYKSFLNNAIYIREFKWVEKFIEEFCPQLEEEYIENMYHYSYAFLYRAKGENEKSLIECSKVKFDNIILNYDIKLITLMNYYELKEFNTALSFIDSLMHFLNSNKNISENYKSYFGNFVKSIKRLILINNSGTDSKKLNSLRHDVENYETAYARKWLVQNIDLLEIKSLKRVSHL